MGVGSGENVGEVFGCENCAANGGDLLVASETKMFHFLFLYYIHRFAVNTFLAG